MVEVGGSYELSRLLKVLVSLKSQLTQKSGMYSVRAIKKQH